MRYTKQDVKDLAHLVDEHKSSVKKIKKYSSPEAILRRKQKETKLRDEQF